MWHTQPICRPKLVHRKHKQSCLPVEYDPYKPQIQIQLFSLPLKLLKSKVKGGEIKFS